MIEVNTENYTVQGLVTYARAIASDTLRKLPEAPEPTDVENALVDIHSLLSQALQKIKEGDRHQADKVIAALDADEKIVISKDAWMEISGSLVVLSGMVPQGEIAWGVVQAAIARVKEEGDRTP